ncbi:hypothetical protein D2E98_18325 [Mycobacteroides abscessus]|nr:hypothetical protein DDJ47_20380 [Mycobacteroides abscessus]RIT08646.1 hypothetical protein D2E74_03465 [Mycobacteroides abscessus]RIT40367.1 hypothetical protein D2E98_18325 [Mycobacteroides abscessus]
MPTSLPSSCRHADRWHRNRHIAHSPDLYIEISPLLISPTPAAARHCCTFPPLRCAHFFVVRIVRCARFLAALTCVNGQQGVHFSAYQRFYGDAL